VRPIQPVETTQDLPPVPPDPAGRGLQRFRWLLVGGLALVLIAAGFAAAELTSGGDKPSTTAGSTTSLAPSAGDSGVPASPDASVSASVSASASPSAAKPSSAKPAGPPAQSGYPNASNTGVPAGTKLTTYSGPCTVTADNTVIDSKTVNCDLQIKAKNVTIKRSKVNGLVGTSETTPYSFTLEDSEVDAGFGQYAAVGTTNITLLRANVHGGVTSVY